MALGKTTAFSADLLKLIFNGTVIANIADNAASSPAGTLYLSLHASSPGDAAASGQSTNETTYPGYARLGLVRSTSGWVVNSSVEPPTVSPASNMEFPQADAGMSGSVAITHMIVGTASTGNGKALYVGAITPSITVAAGVIPRLTTATTITED